MRSRAFQRSLCRAGGAGLWLALLLMAALPASAAAQGLEGFGVRGGLSLAQVRGGTFSSVRAGATAGLYGRFALGNGFSLQPELVYVRKGVNGREDEIEDGVPLGDFPPVGEVEVRLDEVEADVQVSIDFVEVPLLIRYALPERGRLAPSFYVGPYVGLGFNRAADVAFKGDFAIRDGGANVLFSQRIDEFRAVDELLDQVNALIRLANAQNPDANLPLIENPVNAEDLLERVDYGLTFGADLGLEVGAPGGRRIVVGLRYDLGLRELTKQDDPAVQAIQDLVTSIDDFRDTNGFEGKTSTLSILLGLSF